MSAAHEKSDAAEEEKQVALSYDVLSQVGPAEGVGRDYELKCNLSKQEIFPFVY
jgi:hypothetical protein